MSFDGAKVRRKNGLRKRFWAFVCGHKRFVDASQIMGEISIFLYFRIKLAAIWQKMRNFAG